MALASKPTTPMALRTSACMSASVTLVGGVLESKYETLPRLLVWMAPAPSEYCVMMA